MKHKLPYAILLFFILLLLFPAAAIAGAKEGLTIWQERLLPTLLPCFISLKLCQSLGILSNKNPKGKLPILCLFSLAAGAPNGAKQLQLLVEDGAIEAIQAQRLLPYINQVSPAFLFSIIALLTPEHKRILLPFFLSFYLVSAACLCCFLIINKGKAVVGRQSVPLPFAKAFSLAIENSMLDILRVCGCVVFASSLLGVLRSFPLLTPLYPIIAPFMEVSTGAMALSSLAVPLRVKVSLLCGAAAFGGLAVALQTVCVFPSVRLGNYIVKKLLLACLVFLVCYIVFPLFPIPAAVFTSGQEMMRRTLTAGGLLLSFAVSLIYVFLLSIMAKGVKR